MVRPMSLFLSPRAPILDIFLDVAVALLSSPLDFDGPPSTVGHARQ